MRRFLQFLAVISGVVCTAEGANVVVDGTMGKVAPLTGSHLEITEDFGYRPNLPNSNTPGPNLFHSFKYFSLSSGDTAVFSGSAGINNVLARVTGPDPSTINGKIQSTIPGANLFLINPNGVIFGAGASVDVSGSFVATTADIVRLADGGHFAAKDEGKASLTVAPPSAFGFLTPTPGPIVVSSTINVLNARSVSLIGGDVTLDKAAIDVPNGDLHVISARGTGDVQMDFSAPRPQPVANPNLTRGDVNITNSTLGSLATKQVIIRGGKLVLVGTNVTAGATGPGDGISVQATGDLQMNGGFLYASTKGDLTGQTVVGVSADSATLTNTAFVAAFTDVLGKGGDVHLSIAGKLELSGAASVVAGASENTSGGDVRIEAGSMTASTGASVFTQPSFSGVSHGGNVDVNVADRVDILSGAFIGVNQTLASTSNIFLQAREVFISGAGETAGSTTGILARLFVGEGSHGGLVHLDVSGTLEIRDGGVIDAQTAGVDGAKIEISAGGVLIDGSGGAPLTGINAENQNAPGGMGGVIQMEVQGAVQLLNGGVISTNTTGPGGGGNITIAAESILVDGKGLPHGSSVVQGITSRNQSSDGAGPGGDILLEVRDNLELRHSAEITATTMGSGRGGNIAIFGGGISIANGSLIAAESSAEATGAGGDVRVATNGTLRIESGGQVSVATLGAGSGGRIEIAAGALEMSGAGSAILATTDGFGNGGNIAIAARTGSLSDGSLIAAETDAAGAGGDIRVAFDGALTISGGSRISVATSGLGYGGDVDVRADQLVITGAGSAITAQSLAAPIGGAGGNIALKLGELSLENRGAILVSSSGSGSAGTITVEARREVTLTGDSSITAAASESSGGEIFIQGGAQIELENSRITAEAKNKGGNISLESGDMLHLFDSQITAAATNDGGNIFIDPQFVLLDHALISANAINGRGGNIRIISDYFIASPDSLVTATSERGISGEVTINAINVDLTGSLVKMPSSFIRAESLLRELCTVKLRDFSSFIVEGRGGMAPVPGDWLSSLEPELPHGR